MEPYRWELETHNGTKKGATARAETFHAVIQEKSCTSLAIEDLLLAHVMTPPSRRPVIRKTPCIWDVGLGPILYGLSHMRYRLASPWSIHWWQSYQWAHVGSIWVGPRKLKLGPGVSIVMYQMISRFKVVSIWADCWQGTGCVGESQRGQSHQVRHGWTGKSCSSQFLQLRPQTDASFDANWLFAQPILALWWC